MAAKPGGTVPGADRRPVTVLFADLSSFTALAERLDPEPALSQGWAARLLARQVPFRRGDPRRGTGPVALTASAPGRP